MSVKSSHHTGRCSTLLKLKLKLHHDNIKLMYSDPARALQQVPPPPPTKKNTNKRKNEKGGTNTG
jgi:hypothetical protein